MNEPILRVRNLSKTYMQGKIPVHALSDVSFDVNKGEFLSIVGPSGSGKSTLLSMIGLLDKPTSGGVFIDGTEITEAKESEAPRIRKEKIGFVFQHFNLMPTLTAQENVDIAMRFAGVPRRKRKERAVELLAQIGLAERMNHKPSELSGGEQQRVAIARALANYPAIILADEPTGEVDTKTRDIIVD
ncbi:MAG: ABC transporter ATP-binding protein, partial [Candidatus Methanoperedens sp.]|nr:ABC transporter ATP-binding protein [Candidatus Methanoperedens sp.]